MSLQEYREIIAGWSRAERLRVLRAAGFTCHKMTDAELIDALVILKKRLEEGR